MISAEIYYNRLQRKFRRKINLNLSIIKFFLKKKKIDVNKIKDDLSNGDVNILIGTHSVINKNLNFIDLGLLIVDEEQSFGVGQKEQLKSLFQ